MTRADLLGYVPPMVAGRLALSLLGCGLFGCVHIPEKIRNEFRDPEPGEVSNFRAGPHGRAPGRDLVGPMPELAPAAQDGGAPDPADGGGPGATSALGDAATSVSVEASADGGVR